MGHKSQIEWTDATWNPVTGCSVVSPGCTNCYAMRMAGKGRLKNHPSRTGLTQDTKAGPVWNGEVRLNEQWLTQPLRWRKPRMIFVCAHGDLFHENVPDEWIDKVFAVMALAPQHTFQVLTKRAARMRKYLTEEDLTDRVIRASCRIDSYEGAWLAADHRIAGMRVFPLPNVWLGVSAEDQKRADERIPDLLATPAAIRFVSAEPLLGPIDLECIHANNQDTNDEEQWNSLDRLEAEWSVKEGGPGGVINWVIVGGESGAGARPMHPDWVRSLRDQCASANVPFFFKQWGQFHPSNDHDPKDHGCDGEATVIHVTGKIEPRPSEALGLIAMRALGWAAMCNVGKKAAGAMLDGRERKAWPERQP